MSWRHFCRCITINIRVQVRCESPALSELTTLSFSSQTGLEAHELNRFQMKPNQKMCSRHTPNELQLLNGCCVHRPDRSWSKVKPLPSLKHCTNRFTLRIRFCCRQLANVDILYQPWATLSIPLLQLFLTSAALAKAHSNYTSLALVFFKSHHKKKKKQPLLGVSSFW